MSATELSLFSLGTLSLGLMLACYASCVRSLAKARDLAQATARSAFSSTWSRQLPPISVLKPLCGADDGFLDNLRAIVEQDHPDFELILGSAEHHDPALDVARQLQQEYPDRAITVVSGCAADGANPKVRLLRRLQQFASHEWILISDSNVRPSPRYLREMLSTQREANADLVHCLLAGRAGATCGDRLEDLQLGGWVAPVVCFTNAWGHACVIGKSMLMRRSALESVGGFVGVKDMLAEDYVLGSRFAEAGFKTSLCPYVLQVINRGRGLAGFFNRHTRWGQMRRHIAPGYYLGEVCSQPLLFFAPLLPGGGRLAGLAVLLLALKWACEAAVLRRLGTPSSPAQLYLLPLKDLLVPTIWLVSWFKRTVNWRGSRFLVTTGSVLLPANEAAVAGPDLVEMG